MVAPSENRAYRGLSMNGRTPYKTTIRRPGRKTTPPSADVAVMHALPSGAVAQDASGSPSPAGGDAADDVIAPVLTKFFLG